MNDKKNIEYMEKAIELYKDGAILECKDLLVGIIDNIVDFEQEESDADSWSIKDVANTFKKHGLIREQEPCEMTAEEYRQRMIQAFHNADTDELIAVCVLPTEKEFEHLEWLLKNHYKNEPCGDAIDRAKAIMIASGYCHPANVAKELAKLPPVNPQPCEDAISRQAVRHILNHEVKMPIKVWKKLFELVDCLPSVNPTKTGHWIYKQYGGYPEQGNYHCSECDKIDNNIPLYCPNCGAKMVEPQERSDKK